MSKNKNSYSVRNKVSRSNFKYKIILNNIRLEASSMCQLNCPLCITGTRKNKKGVIGWGYLKFQDFKNFLKENPNINNIELSNYGEIFLNPELKDIIKYAYTNSLHLTAKNGVNLNTISEDITKCLVKYEFRVLSVSIDGATNKTYQIYRVGGNFNKVINNVKKINYYKKKYKKKFPRLIWQFVIFGHNEHEFLFAKKMAEKLDMKFTPKFNWDPLYSPVKDKEFVRKESNYGVASREEFMQKYKKDHRLQCYQLWFHPQINWDGKLLGCCSNIFSDFGNVFVLGLKECLKSEKYIYTKRMLLGEVKARKDIPCFKCRLYINKIPQRYLDLEYIEEQTKNYYDL